MNVIQTLTDMISIPDRVVVRGIAIEPHEGFNTYIISAVVTVDEYDYHFETTDWRLDIPTKNSQFIIDESGSFKKVPLGFTDKFGDSDRLKTIPPDKENPLSKAALIWDGISYDSLSVTPKECQDYVRYCLELGDINPGTIPIIARGNGVGVSTLANSTAPKPYNINLQDAESKLLSELTKDRTIRKYRGDITFAAMRGQAATLSEFDRIIRSYFIDPDEDKIIRFFSNNPLNYKQSMKIDKSISDPKYMSDIIDLASTAPNTSVNKGNFLKSYIKLEDGTFKVALYDRNGKKVNVLFKDFISVPIKVSTTEMYLLGKVYPLDESKWIYQMDPADTVSPLAKHIPASNTTSPTRVGMAVGFLAQAMQTEGSEESIVTTGEPIEDKQELISPYAGKIVSMKNNTIVLDTGEKIPYIDKREDKMNKVTNRLNRYVKVGDTIKKGDKLIGASGITQSGQMKLGINVLAAVGFFGVYNYEDAIIISESLSKRLAIIDTGHASVNVINPKIKVGLQINKGFLLGNIDIGSPILGVAKMVPFEFKEEQGRITKISIDKDDHGRTEYIIEYEFHLNAIQGDKVAFLSGSKSIIGYVMPDDQMPFVVNENKYVDCIVAPTVIWSRTTMYVAYEPMLSKIGQKMLSIIEDEKDPKKRVLLIKKYTNVDVPVAQVKAYHEKMKALGAYQIKVGAISNLTQEKLIELCNELGIDPTGQEDVKYKDQDMRVFVGRMYMMRLFLVGARKASTSSKVKLVNSPKIKAGHNQSVSLLLGKTFDSWGTTNVLNSLLVAPHKGVSDQFKTLGLKLSEDKPKYDPNDCIFSKLSS